jgi:hypothetical protein
MKLKTFGWTSTQRIITTNLAAPVYLGQKHLLIYSPENGGKLTEC